MCGIAGYFGPQAISDERIASTLKSLRHRGPDGEASYHHETKNKQNLYLIHVRLAIIDLDPSANQPMHRSDHTLCFNGEIYNYRELRKNLENKNGVKFTTQSDTEVFLEHLRIHGVQKTLKNSEGMWAAAYFDGQSFFLARDRFAEKPLYYLEDQGGIYFASELPALFALLGQKPKLNQQKLLRYLYLGYRAQYQDDSTFFNGVKLLNSGHYLEIDGRTSPQTHRYFDHRESPGNVDHKPFLSLDECLGEIRKELLRAVELRLRSDVPIAFCMSGGVDSMSLISIAKRICNYDVHGFTITSDDERYDESSLVNQAVDELGIRHTFVSPQKENFWETLQTMVRHRNAPIATISYYVHFILMRAIAANGYKVSISGTGADELFTGYYDHFLLHMAVLEGKDRQKAEENWRQHILTVVRNPTYRNPNLFIDHPDFREHLHQDYSQYSPASTRPEFHDMDFGKNLLRNRMDNELFLEVVPPILIEDDNNAMFYSIENRSPFLDTTLYETCTRIPDRFLIQDGYAKYVLRQAMTGILPDSIRLNRRKVGFNASLHQLIPQELSHKPEGFLGKDSLIFEIVNREKVIEMFKNKSSAEKFLFNFLCAKIFVDLFS